MFADWPLLSLVVWLPIIGGVAVLLSGDKGNSEGSRRLALIISIATFVLSLSLYTNFDSFTSNMQFEERFVWISDFNIYYHSTYSNLLKTNLLLSQTLLYYL